MSVKPNPSRVVQSRIRGLSLNFGAAFLSGLGTGIVSGLLLRVIMGIVALAFPELSRGLTLEGVLALLLIGTGFSLANSVWFGCVNRHLPKHRLVRGLGYGAINAIVYGIPFFLSNPDNDLFGPQAPLGIALFTALFLCGGLMLTVGYDRILNWAREGRREKVLHVSFAVLLIPAMIMLIGTTYEMFDEVIPRIRANW